ncbi:MAG: hypothetical protein NDF55_10915 [archaeon GB-1867-005]|nr:hypothetical protein [Candidatus Culexmicrobium cathedralense]
MNLKDYLEKHGIMNWYEWATKYLKLPSPEEVEVLPYGTFKFQPTVNGFTGRDEKGKLYVTFKNNPPNLETFSHELIHLAGHGEIYAFNLDVFLAYAIKHDLPPFNVLALLDLSLNQVESVLREFGFKSIDEYFNHRLTCENEQVRLLIHCRKILGDCSDIMKLITFIQILYEFFREPNPPELEQKIFRKIAEKNGV